MSEHFRAIGFEVDSPERLKELAHQAISLGDALQITRKGLPEAVFRWDLGRGLYVIVGAARTEISPAEHEIICCLPAFFCDRTLHARAYRIALHPKNKGELIARIRLENGAELQMALPDPSSCISISASGADRRFHLAGLAVEASCWNENSGQPSVVELEGEDGSRSRVDSLCMPLDRDNHVRLLGVVQEAEQFANMHSGNKLWQLVVRTAEFALPILAPEELFDHRPLAGDRFEGIAWLHGRYSEEETK